MKSQWSESEASQFNNDPIQLRVYTSRLLGLESDLVLHGGGNTSVKVKEKNIFGEEEEILYVKGSGWDLATIEAEGFAPVRQQTLLKMAELEELNDMDMVKYQRAAMTNPYAPNPSVEAILHAIIPFKFVDHTHADAVVTITNTPNGAEKIKEIYGSEVFIVPYVMPGFILAKEIYRLTKDVDWSQIKALVLLNHGVFTFHEDARVAYENMIEVVDKAEQYLASKGADEILGQDAGKVDLKLLALLRSEVSKEFGKPLLARLNNSPSNNAFSKLSNVKELTSRGPLTPDHIIRTKRTAMHVSDNAEESVREFASSYQNYFDENKEEGLICLDKAPRWAVLPDSGTIAFGNSVKNIQIIDDIAQHTMKSIVQAEALGGWKTLDQKDLFEMEYWVLEQAKLKKGSSSKSLQGKVALVTGAASGIGKACVEKLLAEGVVVTAIDLDPKIMEAFPQKEVLCIQGDITEKATIETAIEKTILAFGGIDLLVANAGIFTRSYAIDEMNEDIWQKSLEINLTAQQRILKACVPYLELGVEPAVVFIGSKNVPAPGPGAAAYSVAKAGLTQLVRIAALEFGKKGIRVNTVHPNAVYDTGIWTDEVLKARAKHYGLSVEEYKTNNILKTEVTSNDVAELVYHMLSKTFSKTTGAQVPIDGGNERVI